MNRIYLKDLHDVFFHNVLYDKLIESTTSTGYAGSVFDQLRHRKWHK